MNDKQMNSKDRFDIIYMCAGSLEDKVWINTHRIGLELSKRNRVLFVEVPVRSYFSLFKVKNLRELRQKLSGLFFKSNNLIIYKPLHIIPIFLHFGAIRKINKILLRFMLVWRIRKIIQNLGFKSHILWIYYIEDHHYFIGKFKEQMVIYDCVDNISTFPRFTIPWYKKRIEIIERKVLKKSNIVFATTKKLVEIKRKIQPHVYYVPNVGDFEHFNKVATNNLSIPEDILKIKKPIIGYIGTLRRYRINFSLINFIAKRHPEWSIVLIGPFVEQERDTFPEGKNIYYLGWRNYRILPNYIKAFDVCILPYDFNNHTTYAFPLKFWEFMATGKPIVASYLPALEEFADLVPIVKTKEEFVSSIETLLEKGDDKKYERINLAEKNTWSKRVDIMLE
ncbi:MAG: hypothetical protein DRP76_02635, partial [Candidatus Omnitrophota bacterium]